MCRADREACERGKGHAREAVARRRMRRSRNLRNSRHQACILRSANTAPGRHGLSMQRCESEKCTVHDEGRPGGESRHEAEDRPMPGRVPRRTFAKRPPSFPVGRDSRGSAERATASPSKHATMAAFAPASSAGEPEALCGMPSRWLQLLQLAGNVATVRGHALQPPAVPEIEGSHKPCAFAAGDLFLEAG